MGKLVVLREEPKGDPGMDLDVLLQKLIVIEQAIGVAHDNTVRGLVFEAESYLLDLQWRALASAGKLDGEAPRRAPFLPEVA